MPIIKMTSPDNQLLSFLHSTSSTYHSIFCHALLFSFLFKPFTFSCWPAIIKIDPLPFHQFLTFFFFLHKFYHLVIPLKNFSINTDPEPFIYCQLSSFHFLYTVYYLIILLKNFSIFYFIYC